LTCTITVFLAIGMFSKAPPRRLLHNLIGALRAGKTSPKISSLGQKIETVENRGVARAAAGDAEKSNLRSLNQLSAPLGIRAKALGVDVRAQAALGTAAGSPF
jgi:hypothetical protein